MLQKQESSIHQEITPDATQRPFLPALTCCFVVCIAGSFFRLSGICHGQYPFSSHSSLMRRERKESVVQQMHFRWFVTQCT